MQPGSPHASIEEMAARMAQEGVPPDVIYSICRQRIDDIIKANRCLICPEGKVPYDYGEDPYIRRR